MSLLKVVNKNMLTQSVRAFSATSANNKGNVAVLGAAGGIGQPLSLLLKNSPLVEKLSVYDIAHAKGVAADLSHMETKAQVKGYVGEAELHDALVGMDVVVIPGNSFKANVPYRSFIN